MSEMWQKVDATSTEKLGDTPSACVRCHCRAYQVRPPE